MSTSESIVVDWMKGRWGADPRLAVGIGDDAAVLSGRESGDWVVTVDLLAEGIHFEADTPARRIGHKALAVNLSDLAAMAAQPVAAFVAIAIPSGFGPRLGELIAGLDTLAEEFGVSIAGGDTSASKAGLTISITAIGRTTGRGPVLRSGGKPGDWLLVTGPLGRSLEGHHLSFTPRVREALRLHESAELHAMIDLSDGLASDLPRLCDASRCGAELDLPAIPVRPTDSAPDGRPDWQHALEDGEDFELLIALPADQAEELVETQPLSSMGSSLTAIGRLVDQPGVTIIDDHGGRSALRLQGFEHRW